MATLEHHYRDMCDIEFTIERGKLWMLQTRVGKRTPEAAFRIATHMVDEGLIDLDEALRRVTGAQLGAADVPAVRRHRPSARCSPTGMNASPGAAVGKVVFDSDDRRGVGRAGRGRHPGPQGDQPRRPAGMVAAAGHPDQPRWQDLPRRRGRARHGPHLRVRRRGARRRRSKRQVEVRGGDGRTRAT